MISTLPDGCRLCRAAGRTAAAILLLLPAVSHAVEKRTSFAVPLPYLSVVYNGESRVFEEVFISYNDPTEGWAITDFDDRYVRITEKERYDHFHREMPQFAFVITDFEAQQLDRACGSLVRTLEIMETGLQRARWDRLLYLDSYLAPFLRGFYYLVTAARCARDALPAVTCIHDSLCTEDPQSPLAERRIEYWCSDPEYVTKFRIVIRELVFQTEEWQRKDLAKRNRPKTPERHRHGKFEAAYDLFVRMYFGWLPPAR